MHNLAHEAMKQIVAEGVAKIPERVLLDGLRKQVRLDKENEDKVLERMKRYTTEGVEVDMYVRSEEDYIGETAMVW